MERSVREGEGFGGGGGWRRGWVTRDREEEEGEEMGVGLFLLNMVGEEERLDSWEEDEGVVVVEP